MKSYYITFYDGEKAVCGTWKRAKSKEGVMLDAEFALICHYPNVNYTSLSVTNERP